MEYPIMIKKRVLETSTDTDSSLAASNLKHANVLYSSTFCPRSDNREGSKTTAADLVLKIGVGGDFDLGKAICNHGFFMTAPNKWNPLKKSFHRPLRLANATSSVNVTISKLASDLLLRVHDVIILPSLDEQAILDQVARMLRISSEDNENVKKFHGVHIGARMTGFGRLFRAPQLFEDIIKTILLCNTNWERALQMCQALCELQGAGNFPNSKELVILDEEVLKNTCRLGYRAKHILHVAQQVQDGKLRLTEFDDNQAIDSSSCKKIYNKLLQIEGVGDFAATTIFVCIGIYYKVPIDSETIAHMKRQHRQKLDSITARQREREIDKIYEKFAPYQCLAYWYELIKFYEKNIGKLSKVSSSSYCAATSSFGKKRRR